jgi:hypothetical protein
MKAKSLVICAVAIATAITNANAQSIAPPAAESEVLKVDAIGVQIYECKLNDQKAPAWAFVAPEADLFDATGKVIGKHYIGPTWEGNDGSKVVAKLAARTNATKEQAIPHLLLTASSTDAKGMFSALKSIQRLSTVGGIAPAVGCATDSIGKQARVYYAAEYRYFR